MVKYDVVAQNVQGTVVAEYNAGDTSATRYQSEAALEQAFIKQLGAQGYEPVKIHTESELIANLRSQLEKLNKYLAGKIIHNKLITLTIINPIFLFFCSLLIILS